MHDLHDDLMLALRCVRRATRVCRAVQAKMIDADALRKKDRSPVTVADFASQAIICATLAGERPDDAIVGEEGSADLRQQTEESKRARQLVVEYTTALLHDADDQDVLDWIDRGASDGRGDRYWTVDPIDGTKGFLRGEQYAIALSLIERGHVVLGVLGCPNLSCGGREGSLLYAARGSGAFQAPLHVEESTAAPIHVDTVDDTANARFCESVESAHSDQSLAASIARKLGITLAPIRMDSQAKYATVARGDASIYLRLPTRVGYEENIWDHAAGVVIVEEAGGRVSDIAGQALDFSLGRTLRENHGVVATNGAVHEAVLEAIAASL